jgi:multidrug transporter EmrE-like cation transporter
VVFGRVPLFYFVVHFYLIHLLRLPLKSGVGLGAVYAVWIGLVIAMYPLCVWYSGLKERRRDWWLSYL